MNPEFPKDEQAALEASLTALLLGELPHEEAAALHQRLAQDTELAKLYERLKQAANLVRETLSSPAAETATQPVPLKLAEERRQKLLQHFKTVAPKEFSRSRRRAMPWLVPVGIAAGLVVILGGLFLPALSKSKSKGQPFLLNTRSLLAPTASAPLPRTLAHRTEPSFALLSMQNRTEPIVPAPEAAPPPAKSVHTGIVLPNATQPADATTLPLLVGGANSWAASPANRRLYDDSLGRVGGSGVGVTVGGGYGGAGLGGVLGGGLGGGAASGAGQPAEVKQGKIALGDGSVQGWSRSSFQDALKNTGDTGRAPGSFLPVAAVTPVPSQNQLLSFQLSPAEKPSTSAAASSASADPASQAAAGYRVGPETATGGLEQASMAGKQVPVLGDVAALGRLFRSKSEEVGGSGQAKSEALTARPSAGLQEGVALKIGSAKESLDEPQRLARAASDSRAIQRQIAKLQDELPVTQRELLERKSMFGVSVPGQTNGTETSVPTHKSSSYSLATTRLDELQRSRQILDTKIASEKIDTDLPKTMMVEIVDKAVPQPAQSPTLGERVRNALSGKVERTARVKVERDQSDISGFAERGSVPSYDPYFVQTEFEAIQSEAVLGKVIKDLNLNEAWGKKESGRALTTAETMALLKNKLDLRPERNTSLIDIGVKSDRPEEAAKIANAVAEAYKAHRLAQRTEMSRLGIKSLEERFAAQKDKVEMARQRVDKLREELNISDAVASGQSQTDVAPAKPAAPAAIPQPEVQTSDNAFSTFSLNVSDVSFKLAGASLEKGLMPEPASVRSEEFINAFDYRDPEPPPGVPVAFAWERAQYPFAQNRDLLRFSIKTAALGREPGRPLNLVLLLDNSGSMERADRVRIIHEALRVLAGQLQAQDKFSIVTFARTARLWVDGVPGNQAAQVVEQVSDLTPQGGTNLEDAMNLGYQTALRHYLANGVNRVVLLTDGAANLGNVDPEALKQKVEANRKQGIALDCFGIGWEGYNDDLLEVLSRNGDGRYGFVNTPEEAATEFAGQLAGALHVAASDVKVQVEFNPARVTAYRQLGYAKHQLTKEQFRDNTVNAAQIGAAESGNALYTVEVNPAGSGPLCTVHARFRIPGTADYREHAWDVPFIGNAMPLEQSSPAMRLAVTASAFSEWLVASPYAGEVTPDSLLGYLSGVPEVYGADARPKKLEWMIRQAKSIAGK